MFSLFDGGFKSADARRRYLATYDELRALTPPPDVVHDVPTEFGTVRMYQHPVFTKMLMLVAESENVTYLAQLRVSTTEPDNPTYQRDSQAMLDGFVYLPYAR